MNTGRSLASIQATTLALARDLIARQSLTPDDGGILSLIGGRLGPLGFRCERMDQAGVRNLWATHGLGSPVVCLAGHVDVVPSGPIEAWTVAPFEAVMRDGLLIGRGAADMKASVAAMVTAVERFVGEHPDHAGTVAVLLTSDEEGNAEHGTRAIVETLRARGDAIDYCIVGEPTSVERMGDMLKNGRRGSLNGSLVVKGVQGHVAYPERGRNPVHLALPALAELCSTVWDAGDAYFGPTGFQISNVHAGTGAHNVTPGALQVEFNLRFSPASVAAQLKQRVAAVLAGHGLDFEIDWHLAAEPFLTPAGRLVDAVSGAVEETTGIRPVLSTTGGTSDGRFLATLASEVVEFGPINESIHKVDEHVAIADLGPLSTIYETVVQRLL